MGERTGKKIKLVGEDKDTWKFIKRDILKGSVIVMLLHTSVSFVLFL